MTTPGRRFRCPECKKVIQSKHRHDFVSCGCPNEAFVDGGSDYLRCGYKFSPPIEIVEDLDSKNLLDN